MKKKGKIDAKIVRYGNTVVFYPFSKVAKEIAEYFVKYHDLHEEDDGGFYGREDDVDTVLGECFDNYLTVNMSY